MSDSMTIRTLSEEDLMEALKNSEYKPKHKIIMCTYVGTEYKGSYVQVHHYNVLWDDVDGYPDPLMYCDTLYITEVDGKLYADI